MVEAREFRTSGRVEGEAFVAHPGMAPGVAHAQGTLTPFTARAKLARPGSSKGALCGPSTRVGVDCVAAVLVSCSGMRSEGGGRRIADGGESALVRERGDVRGVSGNRTFVKEIALPAVATPETTSSVSDVERFEHIWTAHYGAVHAYAARRVGGDAEEVCAEVFLAAWRRFHELPPDPLPWLLASARNVIGTTWRSETRRARLQDRLYACTPEDRDVDRSGRDSELFAALARLGDGDRELLLLVFWEGLSPSRAARVLSIAPGTARTRLWRARLRLRRAVAHEEVPR